MSYFLETFEGNSRIPVTGKGIRKLAAEGRIKPDDKIYDDEKDQLFPASQIKGLQFGEPQNGQPKVEPHPAFTASAPQTSFTDRVKDVESGFNLLDSKFEHMVTPRLISAGYVLGMVVFGVLGLLGILYTIWDEGLKDAIIYAIFYPFVLLGIRLFSEFMILFFRANEHLKEISTKLD